MTGRFLRRGTAPTVAIPSIQVGFFTQAFCMEMLSDFQESQSLLFRSVFSLSEIRFRLLAALVRSRNPFYSGRFFHSPKNRPPYPGGDRVAIPSIQVGFFTQGKPVTLQGDRKQGRNPFYSGRFFHSNWQKELADRVRRNPFYSGRFFHSKGERENGKNKQTSQSLLFRSVFSLQKITCFGQEFGAGVAIPSIQVGFFTRPPPPTAGRR